MGCDIHFYVEKKVKGKWVAADKYTKDEDGNLNVDYDDRFYAGRNYNLFAILANVRNGIGFAGCKTGGGFIPISEPKGLPEDVSQKVKDISDGWDCDGHSHSWFTVKELLDYDWTQKSNLIGVVNAVDFERWNRYDRSQSEPPSNYCGGCFGGSIVHVSEKEMLELIKDKTEEEIARDYANHYTQVEWQQTYASACANFWSTTMPRLLQVGKPEDVRIVFWFDN